MNPQQLVAEAEKLAKPQTGFFSFLSSSQDRLEDASDMYVRAGNAFRLNKDFSNAGSQFVKAADLQQKLGNHNDVANHLVEAYKCYKGVLPQDAIDALSRAIHIFLTQNGQFRRAANFQMDLAELYETSGDAKKAGEAYEQAGDYFSTDHAEALANKAYLKCADLSAVGGEYERARGLYDTIIKNSLGNSLTKWNLKEYFLKNVLCTLAMDDTVEAEKRLAHYAAEEPLFAGTREHKLAQDVLLAVTSSDTEQFANVVFEYDQFSKLDKLKTLVLLKIKNGILDKDDDLT